MNSKPLRLLIVDDLEDWRFSVKLQFESREDIVLAEAGSGEAAVEKVRDEDYDLVLLDLKMPSGTEGLDVLSEIKRLKPGVQVIMMSAYGDIPKAVDAMRRGAIDFVTKDKDFYDVIKFKADLFMRTAHLVADRELLIRLKFKEALESQDSQQKGKALEDLLASLLASIDGFIEVGRNVTTATEEIDLVFRNGSQDREWHKESEIIVVECTNWKSQRVGKNEFVLFASKLQNRFGRCKLGFLVCTETFAETIDAETLRYSKTGPLIVPVDGEQLRQLVESRNRSHLLRTLVDRAMLS